MNHYDKIRNYANPFHSHTLILSKILSGISQKNTEILEKFLINDDLIRNINQILISDKKNVQIEAICLASNMVILSDNDTKEFLWESMLIVNMS